MTVKELRDLLYKVDENAIVCIGFNTIIKRNRSLIFPIKSVTENKTYFPGDDFTPGKTLVIIGAINQNEGMWGYKSEDENDTSHQIINKR